MVSARMLSMLVSSNAFVWDSSQEKNQVLKNPEKARGEGSLFGHVALVEVGPESVLPLMEFIDGGFMLEHRGFEDSCVFGRL